MCKKITTAQPVCGGHCSPSSPPSLSHPMWFISFSCIDRGGRCLGNQGCNHDLCCHALLQSLGELLPWLSAVCEGQPWVLSLPGTPSSSIPVPLLRMEEAVHSYCCAGPPSHHWCFSVLPCPWLVLCPVGLDCWHAERQKGSSCF